MSSGSMPPSDSDSPCAVIGKRVDSCASCSPNWPPTPIQLSGATSRKSTAPSFMASSCGSKPRRRPKPAEVGESMVRMTTSFGETRPLGRGRETRGRAGELRSGNALLALLGVAGEQADRDRLAMGFEGALDVVVSFLLADMTVATLVDLGEVPV